MLVDRLLTWPWKADASRQAAYLALRGWCLKIDFFNLSIRSLKKGALPGLEGQVLVDRLLTWPWGAGACRQALCSPSLWPPPLYRSLRQRASLQIRQPIPHIFQNIMSSNLFHELALIQLYFNKCFSISLRQHSTFLRPETTFTSTNYFVSLPLHLIWQIALWATAALWAIVVLMYVFTIPVVQTWTCCNLPSLTSCCFFLSLKMKMFLTSFSEEIRQAS